MTTTTLRVGTSAGADATWLKTARIGIGIAVLGLLTMGSTMLFWTTSDLEFHYVADYVLTMAALPHGVGLLMFTVGVHRLQHGRDGRLGAVGTWLYVVCISELVVQCMASVAAGAELRWGPTYVVSSFGAFVGLALLAVGSWRVGLVPRWMLGCWPVLGLIGSFLGVGPIPLVFVVFLAYFGVVLTRRVASGGAGVLRD